MSKQFGSIPIEDYLEIVGHKRPSRLKRLGLAAVGLFACVVCTAAGDYFSPWYGSARDVSFEEALSILDSQPAKQWMAEMGMHAAYLHVETVIDRLQVVAQTSPRDAEYASLYLCNLSLRGVQHMVQLRNEGVLSDLQDKHLRILLDGASKE